MILRRFVWRLGRVLYTRARGEGPNVITLNGEFLLQNEFIAWCARQRRRVTVFDVGANVGDWSMSLLAEARRIGFLDLLELHAFEPVDEAFRILDARCSSQAAELEVHTVKRAVSRFDGATNIHIVGPAAGTNSLHRDPLAAGAAAVEVLTCAADTYCRENGIDKIDFFKSDTEGHDAEVLFGAQRLFDEERVTLFQFEYNHRWVYSRHYLKDIFDFAEKRPYCLGKLTRSGVEIIRRWNPELERLFEANYVLVHGGALSNYSHRVLEIDASNTYA